LAAWLQITLELAAGASSKLPYPNVFGNGRAGGVFRADGEIL
jgi:hypothetical protein